MDVLELIKQQVESNPVVIYMKGTPEMPRCGFSQRAAQALAATGLPFAYVNVLEDEEIFDNLPRYADWPTFPTNLCWRRTGRRLRYHSGAVSKWRTAQTDGSGCRQVRYAIRLN